MTSIEKYSLICFAPSIPIIEAMLVMTVVGARFLKRSMAADAAKASQ